MALPADPGTVAFYLADQADHLAVPTLGRRLTTIAHAHGQAGLPSPTGHETVQQVWRGIRRTHGKPPTKKAPLTVPELRRCLEALDTSTLVGTRDRALLLVGFAGAFRRSELAGQLVGDFEFHDDGAVVTMRRSKTDQYGAGRRVGLPYGSHAISCPVRAVQRWLEIAKITDGAMWRRVNRHGHLGTDGVSDRAIGLIVKRSVKRVGLDPDRFGGHSLRSGLATAAARAGAPERTIMAQTGHRNVHTLHGYIAEGSLFEDNAAAWVGL